ncbi:MAG: flippase [Ignavibacteriaceae bacterium]
MDKEIKKNILKGSAATSIGTVSGMVFQFIAIMLMTRFVTKEDFGLYALIMVVVNLFNLLGGLGLELTMVKWISSHNKSEQEQILLPVLILRGSASLITSVIFILFAKYILHFFDDRLIIFLFYIPVIFILSNFRDLFYNLLQGLNQFKHYSIVNVVSSVFRVVAILPFLYFYKLNLEILLIIEILVTLQPLVHQIFIIPFRKLIRNKPSKEIFKKVIKFSIPLYLNNLVVFISGRMNIFLIGLYLSAESIANFDVATKVPVALKKIFQSFIIVYFPNLSRLFSAGEKTTAKNFISKSLSIFSIITIFGVTISFLFREELTVLLFSDQYREIAFAFAMLILNFYFRGVSDLIGYSFVPAGYSSVSVKVNTIATLVSIGGSIILIPIYGFMGAVYSLLAMNIISIIVFYLFALHYRINPKAFVFLTPLMIAGIILIVYFLIGEETLVIKISILMITFIILWFVLDDLRNISLSAVRQLRKLKWSNR